jgi:hypothetical protein
MLNVNQIMTDQFSTVLPKRIHDIHAMRKDVAILRRHNREMERVLRMVWECPFMECIKCHREIETMFKSEWKAGLSEE